MRSLAALLPFLVATSYGCATAFEIPNARMDAPPGPLQQQFAILEPTLPPIDYSDLAGHQCRDRAPSGVTEIALERTSCFGLCRQYTVVFFSDGRVEFEGRANVKRIGTHIDQIDRRTFELLATLLLALVPAEPVLRYECFVTDNPTVYISYRRDGQSFFIMHYAPSRTPPAALFAFEELFDRLVTDHVLR